MAVAEANNSEELRRHPRYPCRLTVDVAGYPQGGRMETLDVSRSGLFIKTHDPASVNQGLDVIVLPASKRLASGIQLKVEVVRVVLPNQRGAEPGMGVRIRTLDTKNQTHWHALLDALVVQADSAPTQPIQVPTYPPADAFSSGVYSSSGTDLAAAFMADTQEVPPLADAIPFPASGQVPSNRIPLTARPRLVKDADDLRQAGVLDKERAFVLLYVDGSSTVEDIVEMVHFDPLQTMEILLGMVVDGILEW